MSGFSDVILYLAVANAAIFVLAAGSRQEKWRLQSTKTCRARLLEAPKPRKKSK